MLALPDYRVIIQLTYKEIEAAVTTHPIDVTNRQSGVFLGQQLESEPLKRVPIKLTQSLMQGVHAHIVP
jgi:hypothetical protein